MVDTLFSDMSKWVMYFVVVFVFSDLSKWVMYALCSRRLFRSGDDFNVSLLLSLPPTLSVVPLKAPESLAVEEESLRRQKSSWTLAQLGRRFESKEEREWRASSIFWMFAWLQDIYIVGYYCRMFA